MGGRLYVIGGNNDQDGILSSAERFDPEQHLWLKFQELTNATVGGMDPRGCGRATSSTPRRPLRSGRPDRPGKAAGQERGSR